MGKYFGTDGIRGVANEGLKVNTAFKVGQFLGYIYKNEKILIGSDTRVSKDMFEAALCAGITSAGADAYLVGVVSTPAVSYLINNNKFKAGIMISASHNPYYDNGIKVFNDKGEKISEELENEIEQYIDGEISIILSKDNIGRVVDYSSKVEQYIDYLKSTSTYDISNFNIIVDCANGSASNLAQLLFDSLKVNARVIHNSPDGYNINVNCGSTHLESLIEEVKKSDVDLGIAFDGDADRMLAVDSNGNIIDGDLLLYICGSYLKDNKKLKHDTIVTTVMSNIGLYKALDNKGLKYEKTAVGDKYVFECMNENDYSLGGEQSGHIIFKDFASTGDGMLSAVQFLNAIKDSGKTVEQLCEEVTIYPQLLENVKVNDKEIVLNSEKLQEAVKEVEESLHGDGRVLLRPSGTEPLIRVMVEASTIELCQEKVSYLVDIVKEIK